MVVHQVLIRLNGLLHLAAGGQVAAQHVHCLRGGRGVRGVVTHVVQPFRNVLGVHPDVKHPQYAVGQRAARRAEGHFLLPCHGLFVQGAVRVAVNELLVLVKRIRGFLAGLIEFRHPEPGLRRLPGKRVLFHHAPVFLDRAGEVVFRFLRPGFLHQGNRLLVHHADGSRGRGRFRRALAQHQRSGDGGHHDKQLFHIHDFTAEKEGASTR